MDLILINPGNRAAVYGQVGELHGIAPPLGIGLIAAWVRQQGHSVEIIDAQAENLSPEEVAFRVRERNPLLAGVSAFTPQMTAATEIVEQIRHHAPHVRTIIGGHHPAALPERTLRETGVDFVCVGEGFQPVADLLSALGKNPTGREFTVPGLACLKDGTYAPADHRPLFEHLDELPFIAWDLLPMHRYRAHNWHGFGHESRSPYAVIFTSLGCPFNCSYCSVNAVYGERRYRTRSPEHVLAEIDLLVNTYGIRHMEIVDDTFTIHKARVHRICDLLIERDYGLNLWAYARTDTVDAELLAKMKRAGIHWVCYGFESGSDAVRKGVNKQQDRIGEVVEMTYAAGMNIMANYLFGLPDDDLRSMEDTLSLALEINGEYANFYCAMAYPGSRLYDDAVSQGLPLPEVWHGYSQYAYETLPLPTKHLSAAEVLRFRDRAFVAYFSDPRYQDKIRRKFGEATVASIRSMLKITLKRKYI